MNTDSTDAAGESPVGAFANCHVGIISKLEELGQLPALAESAARARRTADDLLGFFEDVIEHHHLDEERELFPAVLKRAKAGPEHDQVSQLVERLSSEHLALERSWKTLRPALRRISNGQDANLDMTTVAQLVAQYRAHATLEEREFLPLAEAVLGRESEDLASLGISLHISESKRRLITKI